MRPGRANDSAGALRHRLATGVERHLYYGWVVAATIFVSNMVGYSQNATFGLYVTPLEDAFGWSRSAISLAQTLGQLTGAVLAPLLGRLVDAMGQRRLMVGAALGGGAAYMLLGRVGTLWQFYVVYALAFALVYNGIAQLIGSVTISRWFARRRGRAMGLVMMGASTAGLVFVPLQTWLIATVGWREMFFIHGWFPILLVAGPALLLMVDAPEELGLGGHSEFTTGAGGAPVREEHWSLREAAAGRTFWLTLAGVMLGNLSVAGFFAHAVPHMEQAGFDRSVAGAVWSLFFLVNLATKLGWGFITERIGVRWALTACFAGEALGLWLLLRADTVYGLVVYAVIAPLGHGPFLQLISMVWAEYYGRRAIGTIYGAVQPAMIVAGATGPLLGGVLFDLTGDYRLFLELLIVLTLCGAALIAVTAPPRREAGSTAEKAG